MKLIIGIVGGLVLSGSAVSQEITQISAKDSRVQPGDLVTLQIDFDTHNQSQVWCGLEVKFGDGEDKSVRVGDNGANDFPMRITHSYRNAGEYIVKAEGKTLVRGFKTAGGCAGKGQEFKIVVIDTKAEELARKGAELQAKEVELKRLSERLEKDKQAQASTKQEAANRQSITNQSANGQGDRGVNSQGTNAQNSQQPTQTQTDSSPKKVIQGF